MTEWAQLAQLPGGAIDAVGAVGAVSAVGLVDAVAAVTTALVDHEKERRHRDPKFASGPVKNRGAGRGATSRPRWPDVA